MFKYFFMIIMFLFNVNAFSQTALFGQAANKTQAQEKPKPVSADEFKKQVKNLGQGNQSTVQQEAGALIKKLAPAPSKQTNPTQTPATAQQSVPAMTAPAQATATTTTTTTQTPVVENPQVSPQPVIEATQPATVSTTTTQTTTASPSVIAPTQKKPAPYTGFGGASTNNQKQPANGSSKNTGWNIKY